MTRPLSFLLAIALAAGFAACGGSASDPTTEAAAPPSPAADPTIVTHDFEDGTLEGEGFQATESNTPLNRQKAEAAKAEAMEESEGEGDGQGQGEPAGEGGEGQ